MGIIEKPIASFSLFLLASQVSETLSGLHGPCSSAPSRCLISVCCIELSPCSFPFALQLPVLSPSISLSFSFSLAPCGFLLSLRGSHCHLSCLYLCLCLSSPSQLLPPTSPLIKKKVPNFLGTEPHWGKGTLDGGRKRDHLSLRRPLRGIEKVCGHLAKLGPPSSPLPTQVFLRIFIRK